MEEEADIAVVTVEGVRCVSKRTHVHETIGHDVLQLCQLTQEESRSLYVAIFFVSGLLFRMDNEVSSTKEEGFLSRMALNDNKAGMEGLDRDKINKIIMETSKVGQLGETPVLA